MGRTKSKKVKGSRAPRPPGMGDNPGTPSLTQTDSEAGDLEVEEDECSTSDRDEEEIAEQAEGAGDAAEETLMSDGDEHRSRYGRTESAAPPRSPEPGLTAKSLILEERQATEEASTYIDPLAAAEPSGKSAGYNGAVRDKRETSSPNMELSFAEQKEPEDTAMQEPVLEGRSVSAGNSEVPEQAAGGDVNFTTCPPLLIANESSECNSSVVPESGQLQFPSTAAASDTDFIVLAAEVERLEGALAETQQGWEEAKARLEEAQGGCAELPAYRKRISSLTTALEDRDVQLRQAHQERGELKEEIKRLKERVVEVRTETRKQVQKTETDAVRARVERAERALEHERKGKNRIEKQLAEAMGVNQAGAAALEELSALKEQLRDTQTELDAAQEGLAAETALVDRLKDQLTALLASGDVKLREHAEMWAELKQLREEAAVTESEKAACEQELEAARLAAKTSDIKASNTESLCLDLQAKCQSLGETLGKMMDENTELAEVLNRNAVQERSSAKASESGKEGAVSGNEEEAAVGGEDDAGNQEAPEDRKSVV